MTFGGLLALCAFIGALAGAIAFLFKSLVETKNQRITELVSERDYWRGLVGIEARLVDPPAHALIAGANGAPALPAPTPASTSSTPTPETHADGERDRFAYYSLLIQAGISVVVLILSFWLIAAPTEPSANTVAYNLITFIVGVWLGRGVDYATRPKK
jgi:hypothetical protein